MNEQIIRMALLQEMHEEKRKMYLDKAEECDIDLIPANESDLVEKDLMLAASVKMHDLMRHYQDKAQEQEEESQIIEHCIEGVKGVRFYEKN